MNTPILDRVSSPEILKFLDINELQELAKDLRKEIINIVSKNGGHLSSNLGVIELTIALHSIYDSIHDKIIWDVGHQSYAHKILTGRRSMMQSLRQIDGISGFPKRSESKHDAFGTAHSSTSISAALGMAVSAKIKNINRNHIAIIGDGAMSGGMTFEAINNAGAIKDINLLVILNDNYMSISSPVGALNNYLENLISHSSYSTVRNTNSIVLEKYARNSNGIRSKANIIPSSNIFENLGFTYIGPIDGHNLEELLYHLKEIKNKSGLYFLHIITKKGMGYKLAELDPILYHGPGKFDPMIGVKKNKNAALTFTEVFGKWICDVAQKDPNLVCITPAMKEGSGLTDFANNFPNRYFDVGIAEQHAITFAAGMACDGMKPIVSIYSTFLQRGYDQLIHDVAIQNLDVTFAIDRAGLVGFDGETHAGNYDISFLRCIPNMIIAAPSNKTDMIKLLYLCYRHNGPSAIRYPKGICTDNEIDDHIEDDYIGKSIIKYLGKNIAILAFGELVNKALTAAKTLNITLIDMRFIKPLDEQLIIHITKKHKVIITIEDGTIIGGAGSAVSEFLNKSNINIPILHLGLPDMFIGHGDKETLMKSISLDEDGILNTIKSKFFNYLINVC